MYLVPDIRETRVWQEAREEGRQEGIALAIEKMAATSMPAEEIAAILDEDLESVRQVLNQRTPGRSNVRVES